MILQLFFQAPLLGLAWTLSIILALTVHEFSHALVGAWRGDHTAEQMGRLTLNPLAHLDIIGTIMLLAVGFGWAKPVPFDPRNLQKPAWDGLMIALAGPFSNLLFAAAAAIVYRAVAGLSFAEGSLLPIFLILLIFTNLLLMLFNILPIPPLDGSKVIDALSYRTRYERIGIWLNMYGPRILLGLVILSLLTSINVFGFIQVPAIVACDQMTGVSCLGSLTEVLGS